jgi:hypothetical protein
MVDNEGVGFPQVCLRCVARDRPLEAWLWHSHVVGLGGDDGRWTAMPSLCLAILVLMGWNAICGRTVVCGWSRARGANARSDARRA